MSNINILAIDTSTEACTVALQVKGQIYQLHANNTKIEKSQSLLILLEQLIAIADFTVKDLSALAFAAGPGSLTGLKVASSIMQALSLCYQKPIIKVSTLQALAAKAYMQYKDQYKINYIMPCIDAKMGQIYYGLYSIPQNPSNLATVTNLFENTNIVIPVALQEDQIVFPADIIRTLPLSQILLVGNGVCLIPKIGDNVDKLNIIADLSTDAVSVLHVAQHQYENYGIITNEAIPFYLNSYNN